MNRTRPRSPARRLAGALLPIVLLVAPLAGQENAGTKARSDVERLHGLIGALVETPPAVWEARVAKMRAVAAQERTAAKKLREDAAARVAAADAKTASAAGLDAEGEKLAGLRGLLAALRFRDSTKGSEGSAAAAERLERALLEIGELGEEVWKLRGEAIAKAAAERRGAAKKLRSEAKSLVAKANGKEKRAAELDGEVAKIEGLRAALAKLELSAAAGARPAAAAPKPAAMPKPVAAPKPATVAKTVPKTVLAAAPPVEKRLVTFDDHVYPILDENCITCHDPTDASGGLDLSTYAAALQGGGSGTTIRPGNPDGSRLCLLVSHKEKPTMPPDEPRIAGDLIETLRLWIAQGAPKDAAQASKLAAERAAARAKAAAEAAGKSDAGAAAAVVMPDALSPVVKAYPRQPGAMRAVAVSPAAPLVAVSGFGQVLLLHAGSLRELGVLEFPFGHVERLRFTADGALLLAAGGVPGRSGGAALFDVRTGALLGRFGERSDVSIAAAVSPDGLLVAVGGTRRRLEVFAVEDGALRWRAAHDEWVMDVAFSPDGELIASCDRAGTVLVREAPNGREVHALSGHEGAVHALAFSPDSALLATAGQDRTVRAFRMKDGGQAWSQQGHRAAALCVAWRSPSRLLSGGADGRIVHWKSDGGREPDLPSRQEWVYGVASTSDGARAFAADWNGRLSVIELDSRKIVAELVPLAVAE